MREHCAIFLGAALLSALVGCDQGKSARAEDSAAPAPAVARVDLPVGEHCTVHLRHNVAPPDGVSVVENAWKDDKIWHLSMKQASSVSGKILRSDEHWLVVGEGAAEHWIPKDAVLLVEIVKGYGG